jgi:hypothetical protein
MGIVIWYSPHSLPKLQNGKRIPLCFALKKNDFICLEGYYTRTDNGTNCFVRVIRRAEFVDNSGFINFTEEEEIFLPNEVTGWNTLSDIGIGRPQT